MKVALVGYGKMGRLLDALAAEYGSEVVLRLDEADNQDGAGITPDRFRGVDVAIEFSTPHVAVTNLTRLAEAGVSTVAGTTGWLEQLPKVEQAVRQNGTALVWSPNFSIGVNVFFRLAAEAARLLQAENDYGAWAWEIHHDTKKDAPSGTMLKAVEELKQAGYARQVDVSSNRAGRHPGTHEIGFDSAADTITLRHTARNREGFARGAWKAAQWIYGKQGVYEFSQILFEGKRNL
jgi:4-hydroxy-tetrahydrodipicolinate reductase